MHKIFAIAAVVPAILGIVLTALLLQGLKKSGVTGDNGLTVLGMESYSFILSIIAFALSTMAYMISNRNGQPLYAFNRFSIILSILSLAGLTIGVGLL